MKNVECEVIVHICVCMHMKTYIIDILLNYYWRVSAASETLTEVAQLKIRGDICLFIYVRVDVHMSFCTLTLVFVFASLSTPSHTSTKQNLSV